MSISSVTTNLCNCLKVRYVSQYIHHYFHIPGTQLTFVLFGERILFLEGSNRIAVTNDFQVVDKNLVVRTGVAFGSGNPGLH